MAATQGVNHAFMNTKEAQNEADKGLRAKISMTLVPGLLLYRFASSDRSERWYSSPWWIGQSPYDTIERYARENRVTLGWAARVCLAVDPLWRSRCDVIVGARLARPLEVWTGTPKTVRSKVEQKYLARWEPDRAVTQLYIPGLSQPLAPSAQALWHDVLQGTWHRSVSNNPPPAH